MKFFPFLLLFSSLVGANLETLVEGNERFMQGRSVHPNRSLEVRQALIEKQKPFAIIVACADSRVSPEVLFDQGIGDLFVVRVAGNVIGDLELDSIEYAALYLGASTILVMGHQNCGAVDAVIANKTKDIESVAKLIRPAVKMAKKEGMHDLLYRATAQNALRMKKYLEKTKVLRRLIDARKMQIEAAYYDFESGKVRIL